MKEQFVKELQKLTKEEWIQIIFDLSNENITYPKTHFLGENFPQILMKIYYVISKFDKTLLNNYFDSLIYYLRQIPKEKSNSEIIYNMLYVIHELKPLKFQSYLFQILKDRRLSDVQYGSDNLEDMLIKTLIELEDIKNPILFDYISSLNWDSEYKAYLSVYFYSYIGKTKSSLENISSIIKLTEDSIKGIQEALYNSIVDTVPNYISYYALIEHLVMQKIDFGHYNKWSDCASNCLTYFRKSSNEKQDLYLLFLEDILFQNERNANLYPTYIIQLTDFDNRMISLVEEYYYKSQSLVHLSSSLDIANKIIENHIA